MKNFIIAFFLTISNVFANNTMYLADTSKFDRPMATLEAPFRSERMLYRMNTTKPISAYDSNSQPYTIQAGTELFIDTTLDQIYNSFRNPLLTEKLFSRDSQGEMLNAMDPAQVQMQSIMNELIQIKMEENRLDRMLGNRPSKLRDELIEVKVQKEGKLEKATVDLKKAVIEEALEVTGDEALTTRVPGDYDGTEKWAPAPKQDTTDYLKCFTCHLDVRIPGTLRQTERLGDQLQAETVNQLIMKEYAAYSMDPKTGALVNSIKKNVANSSQRLCYLYVKNALLQSKMASKKLEGVNPRFAGPQLESEGFKNIMEDPKFKGKITDPKQAPKGAILVYEPTNPDRIIRFYDKQKKRWVQQLDIYGHIEVKTEHVGKPGFASDYYHVNARTGNALESADRRLIGIYVKK